MARGSIQRNGTDAISVAKWFVTPQRIPEVQIGIRIHHFESFSSLKFSKKLIPEAGVARNDLRFCNQKKNPKMV